MKAVNGTTEWIETHFEIVSAITSRTGDHDFPDNTKLGLLYQEKGRGGMWEFAEELTDKFEQEYKSVEWGSDTDFFDTLDEFCNKELNQ